MLVVGVAQTQYARQVFVQHAGRGVQEDEYPLASHLDAGDVPSIAPGVPEAADLLPRRGSIQASALESALALFQRADVRLELFDVLVSGNATHGIRG